MGEKVGEGDGSRGGREGGDGSRGGREGDGRAGQKQGNGGGGGAGEGEGREGRKWRAWEGGEGQEEREELVRGKGSRRGTRRAPAADLTARPFLILRKKSSCLPSRLLKPQSRKLFVDRFLTLIFSLLYYHFSSLFF